MPLRSARLTGDPFLESCLNGTDRIFSGRDGLTVMRLQAALLDVGLSVVRRARTGSSDRTRALRQTRSPRGRYWVTANSRAIDLREPFLAAADPVQDGNPVD